MNNDTLEEIRELGLNILITTLMAISTVLLQATIHKIKYGHISNIPSRRSSYRQQSVFDDDYEEDGYEEDDFYIKLDD